MQGVDVTMSAHNGAVSVAQRMLLELDAKNTATNATDESTRKRE